MRDHLPKFVVLLLMLAVIGVGLTQPTPQAVSQEEPNPVEVMGPLSIPGMTSGTGTHFEVHDSAYHNVVLDSADVITLSYLMSVPETVIISIAADPVLGETAVTVSGLPPRTTLLMYRDDYHDKVSLTTSEDGSATFGQDIAEGALVIIQPRESTLFVDAGPGGGDCSGVGSWNAATLTCTLTSDVFETVQIDDDGITIDGNGHVISGASAGFGVFLNGPDDFTAKNLTISGFSGGLFAANTSNTVVMDSLVSGCFTCLTVGSVGAVVTGNTVMSAGLFGVHIASASSVVFSDNMVTGSAQAGVVTQSASGLSMHDNTISNSGVLGMQVGIGTTGEVYNNNFINNPIQAQVFLGTSVLFNLPPPIGGNYWSDFDATGEGCTDGNSDGRCDGPKILIGPLGGQDNAPWTSQNGWSGGGMPPAGILISWEENTDPDFERYEVYRSTDANVDLSDTRVEDPIVVQSQTSIVDDSAPLEQTLWYRVFVFDRAGLSTGGATLQVNP